MEEKKNKILRGQIPTSVFYILFGLCLALMPVETVNVLCKVVFGLVLIGAGVYHILIFVLEKDNSTILDLFSGVIVLVIGIFLFMNPTVVVKLLTLMLGAFILVDSIWMMRGSMKLKKRKNGAWKAFLIESLIFVGLGVLILVNPFSEIRMTVQVSGCIFVANGVLDIIFYLILRHGLKKDAKDAGDVGSKSVDGENAEGYAAGAAGESSTWAQEAEAAVAGNGAADVQNVEAEKVADPGVDTGTVSDRADGENAGISENAENAGSSEKAAGSENAAAVGSENAVENQAEQEPEEVLEEWKD